MIRLRFVAGIDTISRAIQARSQIAMPFTPSHVECVMPDGKYAGQHFQGGMQARDPDYDKSILDHEAFVDIEASDEQTADFYDFVRAQLGRPYDWHAILDFVAPLNFHSANYSICSAVMTLALRKAQIFKWPLAVPAHMISPRDLLLMLSSIVEIPH